MAQRGIKVTVRRKLADTAIRMPRATQYAGPLPAAFTFESIPENGTILRENYHAS